MSAPLFDIGCMTSNAVLADTALLRDGVECELALRIDQPLPLGGCTRDDVLAAVGAVMPAFELLCSRLPAKFASPREHIVADCMGHGAVVLGAPCADWRTLELDQLRVTLWADDAPVVDKKGGNPFGDPLLAVALDATFHLRSARVSRSVAAKDFYQGYLLTDIAPDELLMAVDFHLPPADCGWCCTATATMAKSPCRRAISVQHQPQSAGGR